jgi:regulator of protease activity HflC (stomatin/prohibitin superfamily)
MDRSRVIMGPMSVYDLAIANIDGIALMAGAAAAVLAIWLLAKRSKVTIFDWQTGVLYHDGVFKRTLAPGKHRFFVPPHSWIVFDRRPQFLTVPGQEVLSRDALGLKITLVAEYQIEDAAKLLRSFAVASQAEVANAIYPLIQLPIREAAATYTLDELIQNRDALPELVRAASAGRLHDAGITLIKVAVRDIMIAKELRDAYATKAIAQKTAAATLERARSEVAAMRALANAARMAQGNPELMQLRALQAMQTSDGRHTVIFDFSGKSAAKPDAAGSALGPDDDLS